MAGASSAARRGIGFLVPLIGAASAAEQREAPPVDQEAITQSALAPRDTTDAVARIIFAQIRKRTEMNPEALGYCERLVTTASSSPAVQSEIMRTWSKDPVLKAKVLRLREPEEEGARAESPALKASHARQDVFYDTRAAITCPVCLDPLREAYLLDCGGGHVLCRECIAKLPSKDKDWTVVRWMRWLLGEAPKAHRECPECRRPFTGATAVRRIGEIVDSLRPHLPDEFEGPEASPEAEDDPFSPPKADSEGLYVPYWVMKLVGLVVLIAIVVARKK